MWPTSILWVNPAELSAAVQAAVFACVQAGDFGGPAPAEVLIERPRNPDHGDYATNVALRLAKTGGRPPREIAEAIATRLRAVAGIESVEVAGPGFLNIRLSTSALGQLARVIVEAGADYGRNETLAEQRLNLEFVSANPTGPLHIGGTRWAAVGDALARVLAANGAMVTREYYFNDHGSQIDRFARSLLASARREVIPPTDTRAPTSTTSRPPSSAIIPRLSAYLTTMRRRYSAARASS